MRYRIAALGLLLGFAASPGPAAPDPAPAPAGRITAELGEVTLAQAAEQLSRLTGIRIHVPDRPRRMAPWISPDGEGPSLDLERRARLAWVDAVPAAALREFCRVFDCRLHWE